MEYENHYDSSQSEETSSNSKEDKPVPPSPQSDGTEQPQGERHEVVDDMPEIVDDDLTDEEIQHLCREMGIMISDGTEQAQGVSDSEENKPVTPHTSKETSSNSNKFYRQNESTIEKTHITKLLQVVNSGTIAKYKNKTLAEISIEDVITAATDDVNNETIDDDDNDVDDLDDDSNEEVNVSIDNEVVSEPPSSTSKQSLHEKPKVTLNPTSHVKPKLTREFWPEWIKNAIKNELGDCIHNITNLT